MSEHNGRLPDDIGPLDLASRHVEEELASYAADECSQDERTAIERHLATCAACRAALDETRRIRMLLAPLSLQATPLSVADAVLQRLPTTTEGAPAESHVADVSVSADMPQSAVCPVSLPGDVSLPVARLMPRHRRGGSPSSWRRWEDAPERDTAAMKRDTATTTSARTGASHATAGHHTTGRLGTLAAVAATLALIALGAGIFGMMSQRQRTTTGTPPPQSTGTVVDLPDHSTLDAISMDSATDGWAVGTVYNASNAMGGSKHVLLAHYDGHSWTTSPDSNIYKLGYLVGVSMDSADDGWAVGSIQDDVSAPLRGLVLHYIGGHWQAVDISNTGFEGGGVVRMSSPDDGWLYAPIGAKSSVDQSTLLLHYQHGAWQRFSSLPGDVVFSMLSASDGWAHNSDTGAILHYQGGAWAPVATAGGKPLVMAMVSPTEGWIAGSDPTSQSAFVLRYNGQSWSRMELPGTGAGFTAVDQIAVATAGDVWIFGLVMTNKTVPETVAWHYSAGRWALVPLDFTAYPTGASMASTTSGWLTGDGGNNAAALMRYDNGTWTAVYYGK
jgi:anti-sigma factor RsiW